MAGCDALLGAWLRLPTLPPPPPPPLTQFAESPKRLAAGRAWLWRAALALLVLIPLLAELPQAAAQTPTVPTLKVEIPTVTEGETGTITLTLSQAPSQSFDIRVRASAIGNCTGVCPQGTAAATVGEYSMPTAVITFALGETTKTVSFTTTDDSASEPTEVFDFGISDLDLSSEATIDSTTAADTTTRGGHFWFVHIQDNDNPANPNITIAPGTSPVTEGTAATFTVTATPAPTAATSVSVVVTEDTSSGQDFVALSNETTHMVSIPASGIPGAGTATLTIATVGDSTMEPHGAVTATVSTGTGYTVGNPSSATMTVYDDDGTPLPTGPEVSVALPISEGESRSDAGEKKVSESEGTTGIGFNLSADVPLPSALTVCVRVTESGGDRVTSGSEGIQSVNMPSSGLTNGSGTHTLTWTDTAVDDRDSSVTVEVVAPNTASCSATNGSYTVSSSEASDKLLIQDDEDTTVSLTSTDMTMTEGDASDTAVLTISLDRRLYGGETIGVPIALATTTMARLPGSVDGSTVANHDFEVTAAAASMHSGVTLANALTANPRVVFTGHDTNTVQTATVTLTPVANRDDGDAAHETITATLTSLGLVDTTVSGGVTAHATNNAATLSLEDDEAAPAPEVEVWWDFKGRLGPHPSTLNLEGGGYPEANQNAAPFSRMAYAVRLTNRPESGGTVTVTATVPSDKRHLIGLSLNGTLPWSSSVTVEFKDRDPGAGTGCSNWIGLRKNEYFDSSGNIQTVTGGGNSETWDNTADTPWACWRRIYVIRYSASRDIANTCVDITHTATGGGVRRVAIDTVRAHIINSGSGSNCSWLIGNTLSPQGSPAQATPAPTESVASLQVTAVDDASATVSWDAVTHATSYEVSWSAESSDSLNAIAGTLPSVAGTSATIQHDASVPMTLTVTVTPEYVDKNGDTKQVSELAGTATLDIGPVSQDAQAESEPAIVTPPPNCVSDTLLAKVRHYYDINKHRAPGYGQNWRRVLLAFGDLSDANLTPFTAAEAKARESRWFGWKPVRVALDCIEAG